jgi:hypothetical protein
MFEHLGYGDFMSAINPKMLGAINLHNALKDTPLDFFVMTSSISAVLGNPGQTNYCAGNSFLDSLAWYRRRRGLAATSLALPMVLDVGVVAENEQIEASLSRKGMYGIGEQEMLRGFENAFLSSKACETQLNGNSDARSEALLMMGLDPTQLSAAIVSADRSDTYWDADSRLAHVRKAVNEIQRTLISGETKSVDLISSIKAVATEGIDAVANVVAQHVMQRCASILMLPVETFVMNGRSVASYGLDSMIGAELRNWIFKEFGISIPFQELLAPTMTFNGLALTIANDLDLGFVKES